MYNSKSIVEEKKFIQAFNMFIIIHKTNTVTGIKYKTILILKISWPTTSYVAAMFHPIVGQCTHHSLNNTATPELCMIPKGSREQPQART